MRFYHTVITVALLLFAVAFFVGAMFVESTHSVLSQHGVMGTATIVGKREQVDPHRRLYERKEIWHLLRYRFATPEGKTTETEKRVKPAFHKKFKVGDKLPVRYMPKDPSLNQVEMDEYAVEAADSRVLGWLFLALAGISALVQGLRAMPFRVNLFAWIFIFLTAAFLVGGTYLEIAHSRLVRQSALAPAATTAETRQAIQEYADSAGGMWMLAVLFALLSGISLARPVYRAIRERKARVSTQ